MLHAGIGVVQGSGGWLVEADSTAASGVKVRLPDAGAAKVTTAAASPANYFELSFTAEAGRAYRLWIRGRAEAIRPEAPASLHRGEDPALRLREERLELGAARHQLDHLAD